MNYGYIGRSTEATRKPRIEREEKGRSPTVEPVGIHADAECNLMGQLLDLAGSALPDLVVEALAGD